MIDRNSQFMAILTNVGAAKLANANALGIPWNLTAMGVGDANGTDPIPNASQTKLINERRRAPLNQVIVDPVNAAVIIAEQVIPADIGGWWIHEIGLYDSDGDLVAVSNCAPSFKPALDQGSGRTQIVRMNFIVSSIANIVLKIDPAIVLATREYVDRAIDAVLPANKKAGTYTQVTINKYGIVVSGANPTTLAGYGIIDALRIGSVSRQLPALSAPKPGGTDGSGGGGALLIREAQEVEGTKTDLAYAPRMVFAWKGLFARDLAMSTIGDLLWGGSKVWNGANFNPDAKADKATTIGGYGISDAFTKTQTTAAIQAAIAALVGTAPGALDQLDELARAMGNDPNFATTMLNALAQKADKSTTLAGYGIVIPSQAQSEDGSDNALPMTSLGVAQSIKKRLDARGLWDSSIKGTTNANLERQTGIYALNGAGNGPPGGGSFQMFSSDWGSDPRWQSQFALGVAYNAAFFRSIRKDQGAATAWDEFHTTANLDMVGASVGFYRDTAPTGWLKENGAAVSRTTYARLFGVIGVRFGAGDGSTTFNLPDHRAEFPRGADDGRGVNAGRGVGTLEGQSLQSHDHPSGSYGNAGGTGTVVFTNVGLSGGNDKVWSNTHAAGGAETRPRNIAKLYCIKY
jgi:phage-related tail fiber protein